VTVVAFAILLLGGLKIAVDDGSKLLMVIKSMSFGSIGTEISGPPWAKVVSGTL
jgi:hypothetical protein